MKTLILSLAFMLIGSIAFAGNIPQSDSFNGRIKINEEVKNQKSEVVLTFTDSDSFNDFDSEQLNALGADAECTVSIEVTVTVSVGVVSASATMKAEGVPCAQVGQKIKELRKAALEALK